MENIKTKVFESVGHASMCWKETPKGIFDEQEANVVANKLMGEINSYAARFAEWCITNEWEYLCRSSWRKFIGKRANIDFKTTQELLSLFNEHEAKQDKIEKK